MTWDETPAGVVGMQLGRARRLGFWQVAAGLAPFAVAVTLWVWVLAGVAAPLGGALARVAEQREVPAARVARGAPHQGLRGRSGGVVGGEPCRDAAEAAEAVPTVTRWL